MNVSIKVGNSLINVSIKLGKLIDNITLLIKLALE